MFLGLVVSGMQAFPAGTKQSILDRYRHPGVAILFGFMVGLGVVATATAWLVMGGRNHGLFAATVSLFGVQLAALAVSTVWAVWRIMWK